MMTKKKRKRPQRYASERRARLVELARSGRSPEDPAREFEPTAATIRNWRRAADLAEGADADGWSRPEREKMHRPRQENVRLKREREIPGKAAAWFARETVSEGGGS